jgi:DNA topoisomerase-1
VPKPLVIVESPAKAKTIAGFLGRDYMVESSIGHIRDLPRSAKEVPAAYKGESWARLAVDVDNDFKPLYVIPAEKKQQVIKLKTALKDASELYLATDEDREGESIAWHLLEVLSPRVPVRRMVFHEITRAAIEQAVAASRDLDRRMVDAQEARRVLDRLVGWDVSEVLWKKVMPRLSAGRVQSVATRLVVERERLRMAFRPAGWWGLEGRFAAKGMTFGANLLEVDGKRVATGRDFDDATGALSATSNAQVLNESDARGLAEQLAGVPFAVASVQSSNFTQKPYAPFITSTLQQEAGRKLRFGASRTMAVAQRLYERGYITYMRTDSTNLSEQAIVAARQQARELYGPEYVPDQPRTYERKVKNAQEAHEAIRPAGERFRTPDEVRSELDADEIRVYDLVWKRTVASQMADARGRRVALRMNATAPGGATALADSGSRQVVFSANGRTIEFPGFLRAYVEGADDPDAELEDREVQLPAVVEGDGVECNQLDPSGHTTQPPARFTEASLVKEMESRGIGRPSTYASIITTIQDRGYAWRKGGALVPSWTAFAVIQLLERHFAHLVDYDFTAKMEEDLDDIARGEREPVPWLRKFYFGNGTAGLKSLVDDRLPEIDAREVNSIPIGTDADGNLIVVRVGRYGPYLSRGEETAPLPDELPPDELTIDFASELLAKGKPEGRVVGTDPQTGLEIVARDGRYGPYVQLGEMEEGAKKKPKTASLFKTMSVESVTLEEALQLLSLPRVVGVDDEGQEVTAQNGRFGPYLKKGTDTRSLASEEDLFAVTLDEAKALFAEPKRGRGRSQPSVLHELGADPDNEQPIRVLAGRFGPYVTNGEVNASLPRGADPAELKLEEAVAMLRAKAAAGGGKKKPVRKKATGVKKKAAATKKKKA